jgi:hypothetical protein
MQPSAANAVHASIVRVRVRVHDFPRNFQSGARSPRPSVIECICTGIAAASMARYAHLLEL